MAQTTGTTIDHAGTQRVAARRGMVAMLWLAGLLLILLAVAAGRSIEDQLAATGMPDFSGGDVGQAELVPLLFAFAFPLGLALCALAALRTRRRGEGLPLPVTLGIGAIAVAAPVLVPVLLGRELVSYHFGAGGTVITLAALGAFWSLGRLRRGLPLAFVPALDLGLLGLLCFAAAAWNLCGSAAMPSFLLMPERLARLHTLPFAIGQMKSVLVLLALGWLLVMAGTMLAAGRIRGPARDG
jgi:hypothetical protein